MVNAFAPIICMLLGFIAGYLARHVIGSTREEADHTKHHRKSRLKIIRYWLGNEEFNILLFRVKNYCDELKNTSSGRKVIRQTYHIRDLTRYIAALVIGYDLKWFESNHLDDTVQAEIDLFVKNLEKFNRFLKQPSFVVQSSINEAIAELKASNQSIMDRMGAIKNSIANYIETEGYKLIEYNQ